MKKIILMLSTLLIFSSSLFSLSNVSGSVLDEERSASLQVFFDPRNIEDVDIGFSYSANPLEDEKKLDEGHVEDLLVGEESAVNMNEIYIYWRIFSFRNLSASISIPYALHGESGEIDWNVGLIDGSASISSSNAGEEIDIVKHSDDFASAGSVGLSINTEKLNSGDVIPGEYSGELRLSIKTE